MSRIRTFALLAFAALAAACSQAGPTAAAPDGPSYEETETCRSGWPTSTGRCAEDPGGELGEP